MTPKFLVKSENFPELTKRIIDHLDLDLNLVTISKLSSEIIDRDTFQLTNYTTADFEELRNVIYDKFPALYISEDYKIFWQYSKEEFLEIRDVITYAAAIDCMASQTIYILVDDFEDTWDDNLTFLLDLDRIEEEERKERERDIYDVKIERKSDKNVEIAESQESVPKVRRRVRTESEILSYAIRNEPPAFCYTTDSLLGTILIKDMQKGYPKLKVNLYISPDVEFEKRASKDRKGKKGKGKGKGKDKGKKKGKKKKK